MIKKEYNGFRLEIRVMIRLEFDQSKQNSPNLRLVFFLLIG